MSYYRPRDHFTNGQGHRIRMAISEEAVLRNIVSNSCVSITEVNRLCYSQTKTITLTNLGLVTTRWSSSSNVRILSSGNTNVRIRTSRSNSTGTGWVRSTLSNGIILQEDFDVGVPSSNNLRIRTTGNGNYIFPRTWQELFVIGGSQINWSVSPSSTLTRVSGSNSVMIYPRVSRGNVNVKARARNECGYSPWKQKNFTIYRANNNVGGGIMH